MLTYKGYAGSEEGKSPFDPQRVLAGDQACCTGHTETLHSSYHSQGSF